MASNKRLKAFVRFDGSGRVVPSSLILQRFKPKVGNWLEIPANECCNYTTTTTTTSGPLAFRLLFNSIESADLIVGDSSNVNDWNTFMDLPTLGTPFTSVSIVGSEVFLYGGAGIKAKPGLFYVSFSTPNTSLLGINDEAGCITSVGGDAFSYCYALVDVNLPACTIVYGYQDSPFGNYGGFGETFALLNVSMPLLAEIGDDGFTSSGIVEISLPSFTTSLDTVFNRCFDLITVDFPLVINISPYLLYNCPSLTTINIPACTNLGGTVGNDDVFGGTIPSWIPTGNAITLTVPAVLMTCNAGNPDGDIQTLQANNTVTVITV